jgi:hypothetical protein
VEINGNTVQDNGLDAFFDNEGLAWAMQEGKDFGDGRTQGILTKDCNHVRIHRNAVINSVSEGIGIMNRGLMFDENHRLQFDADYERDLVHDIEIFDNHIERNGEQGIWITAAKRGRVCRNKVIANAHRRAKTAGSTGIMLEGDVSEFDVFDNELAWNDIFAIGIICSSNNVIRANRIHHNGDGGIGWSDAITVERRPSTDNVIEGNQIQHNRVAALVVRTRTLGKTVLKGNAVANNGGNPIHFQFYDDYDMRAHPKDWEYRGTPSLFKLLSDVQKGLFEMEDRSIDGGLKPR